MWREVPAILGAGALLALLEIAWVLISGRGLFLSSAEQLAYAAVAFSVITGCVACWGVVLRSAVESTRVQVVLGFACAGLGGLFGWLLTAGRRVRDHGLRPVLVAMLALGCAFAFVAALRVVGRARQSAVGRRRLSMGLGVVCTLSLALDAWVLPRSYPAFHAGLLLVALTAAALGGAVWARPVPRFVAAAGWLAILLCLVLAPLAMHQLSLRSNASYVVSRVAPFSHKLMQLRGRLVRGPAPSAKQSAGHEPQRRGDHKGIDLRDADVLLITVDALRADALSAYGGAGLMPEVDALAAEGAVFRRAYTTAPHTSYSLSSLLTAKFMKPVLEIPGAPREHKTLPDLFRRYGYRTAAFYPPAIFFVDGARFDSLRERGFGFEYRKEMYASAAARVKQLEVYLTQVDPKRPVFVWVHLFEPHEPYDPPPGKATSESARGRYEGEVRVSDDAIGGLVRVFRAKRPRGTVVVTADHGEEFGEHGGSYHGTTLFDEQARVPLVWSSPGVVAPMVLDVPVDLSDVGTTLLSAAGVPRDARMRGDDLSALLAGAKGAGPAFSFASLDDQHMVTDGRAKLICGGSEARCRLFDLVSDPRETRDVLDERETDAARLRAGLDAFLSSIPKVEVIAVGQGVAWPEALARAKLRAPSAGPDVIPLLGDDRPSVRAAAARALGELEVRAAAPALERVRAHDEDPSVRAEANIAALLVGSEAALPEVLALLGDETAPEGPGLSVSQRAALAAARLGRVEAVPVLASLLSGAKEGVEEGELLRAIEALGRVGAAEGAEVLIELLSDVRLRVATATALGEIGGRKVQDALVRQLREERYQPARRAELMALIKLSDRRTRALLMEILGRETSVPDGVRMLMTLGALTPPSARGARLTSEGVREGTWSCDETGCAPGEGAAISLPRRGASRGPKRATLLVTGDPGAFIRIDGERRELRGAEDQLSFVREPQAALRFAVEAHPSVRVVAIAVVPVQEEIPPPPPEPWQPGAERDAATP